MSSFFTKSSIKVQPVLNSPSNSNDSLSTPRTQTPKDNLIETTVNPRMTILQLDEINKDRSDSDQTTTPIWYPPLYWPRIGSKHKGNP